MVPQLLKVFQAYHLQCQSTQTFWERKWATMMMVNWRLLVHPKCGKKHTLQHSQRYVLKYSLEESTAYLSSGKSFAPNSSIYKHRVIGWLQYIIKHHEQFFICVHSATQANNFYTVLFSLNITYSTSCEMNYSTLHCMWFKLNQYLIFNILEGHWSTFRSRHIYQQREYLLYINVSIL